MIIRKTKKKEIKEDAFVAFFIQSREYIRTHQNHFFIALIALIVAVSGVIWYSNNMKSSKIQSMNSFSEALSLYGAGRISSAENVFKSINNDYSGSREGIYSSYFLGKCFSIYGRNNEAISFFRDYIKNASKYPLYREAAHIGIAVAFENEHDFANAAEAYMDMVDLLSSPETKGYYLEKAADTYKLAGKKREAIKTFEKALELREGIAKREIELKISILKG